MKFNSELKKTIIFIFLPLSIFIIPAVYLINDRIDQRELNKDSLIVLGKVKTSKIENLHNTVQFEYSLHDSTYYTREYSFNQKKMLPLGLPILIKTSLKNPKSYKLLRDSVVYNCNRQIKYIKKFNGGWTYEVIQDKNNRFKIE